MERTYIVIPTMTAWPAKNKNIDDSAVLKSGKISQLLENHLSWKVDEEFVETTIRRTHFLMNNNWSNTKEHKGRSKNYD